MAYLISFYEIMNNVDNYSYIGVTGYHPLNRINAHFSRYYQTYPSYVRNENITLNEYGKICETLYGKGPFETGLNRMAAAIRLYGWENFSLRLIARGYFNKQQRYTIENQLVKKKKFTYNFMENTYTLPESELDKLKSYPNHCYYEFSNSKVDMFSIRNMDRDDAINKIDELWTEYENCLYS